MIINEDILRQVAEKSILNAESLIVDADLLRENNRIQRAYALYQLSLEEVGKAVASILLLVKSDILTKDDIKEYEKTFMRHQRKTKKSSGLDYLVCEVVFKNNLKGAMAFLQESISESPIQLDNNKNNSLYTAIIGKDVKSPAEMIDEKMLSFIWFRAQSRYNIGSQFVKTGLVNYRELQEYGKSYIPPTPEEFAREFWGDVLKEEKLPG